jgi:hypothetical protein
MREKHVFFVLRLVSRFLNRFDLLVTELNMNLNLKNVGFMLSTILYFKKIACNICAKYYNRRFNFF